MLILFISNMEIKATLLNTILFHQGENRIMCFSFQTLVMLKSKHATLLLGAPLQKSFGVKFEMPHSSRET